MIDRVHRTVTSSGPYLRDLVDDVAAALIGHLAEDRVLAVQMRCAGRAVMKNCEPFVPGPAFAMASR